MANTMRWGVEDEDEYKDEHELPAGYGQGADRTGHHANLIRGYSKTSI